MRHLRCPSPSTVTANASSSSAEYLKDAYAKVAETLEKIYAGTESCDIDFPKLVIAFDEAHPLVPQGSPTPASLLCRAIATYCDAHPEFSAWVLFLSTNSSVADFSPPSEVRKYTKLSLLYPFE